MSATILQGARANVTMLENALATMPGNSELSRMLTEAKAMVISTEQKMGINQPVVVANPPQPPAPTLESRVAALEIIVQQAAAPAINEAAKIGMTIMAALGAAMTNEQADWVEQRLDKSPGFFASKNCKDAIDIFITEWQNFEGASK